MVHFMEVVLGPLALHPLMDMVLLMVVMVLEMRKPMVILLLITYLEVVLVVLQIRRVQAQVVVPFCSRLHGI